MDIFDGPYFRLNKKLLCILGLWPFDSQRKTIRISFITLLLILSVPHVLAIIVDPPDMDKVMEDVFNLLIIAQVLIKYSTLALAENKIKTVYNDIANNWLVIVDGEEKRILLEYSKRGRNLSVIYITMLAITVAGFFAMPLVPEILNVVYPLPVPRSHLYILKGEFLVENRDDHFYKIYVWDTMSVFSVIISFMGIDSMYTVTVEQGAALYAILTHRLLKLRGHVLNDFQGATDGSYEWLVHIIKLHQKLLSFTSIIEDCYSACFFCLTVMNILLLPLTCVVALVHFHDSMIFIRYVIATVALLVHVFVLFWPGQKLIDHSTKLFADAYCNDWYEAPAKTKKLLRIFMLRCSKPYVMTAGGLVEMNFKVYSQIVRTAASYVTVLASFR